METDKKTYRRQILSLRKFLEGDRDGLLASLEEEMRRASNSLEFERAASLRDQIHGLQSLDSMACYGDFIPGKLLHLDPMVGIEELAAILRLSSRPRNIAGVDIANLNRDDPVGSLVTFLDGVPFREGYRQFRIKETPGPNDYAMIREVLRRHFLRVSAGKESSPDLLLLDGGRSHLRSGEEEFRRLGIEPPPLVALAKKREAIYLPGEEKPLLLSRHSKALQLLQHVRDEAHRFARRYHHHRRQKRVRAD
jgi:excinuclease ABC subunit C